MVTAMSRCSDPPGSPLGGFKLLHEGLNLISAKKSLKCERYLIVNVHMKEVKPFEQIQFL